MVDESQLLTERGFNTDLAKSAGLAVDRWPQSVAEAEAAESTLAKELGKLSVKEHEQILYDLHGIDTTPSVSETAKFAELEKELSLIREKPAFERAMTLNQAFVENNSFRLKFLRTERFMAKNAAQLMVDHFQIKQELFGDGEILGRAVCLSDLHPEDIACVRSGYFQVCPSKDSAGRTVLLVAKALRKFKDVQNQCRAIWYIIMAALRDEETQKKGAVLVTCNFSDDIEKLGNVKKIHRVVTSLPIWIAGSHYCYSNPWLRIPTLGLSIFLMLGSSQYRARVHYGDFKDVASQLLTYGISTTDRNFPSINNGGHWSVKWHHEWIKTQEAHEREDSFSLRKFDVLFGRGKARLHTGNLQCFDLVEMNLERYEAAGRREKTLVADHIISIVHESKGRFLKWEKGTWVEVEHKVAREKVSHFFRHLRSKRNSTSTPSKPIYFPG